MKATKLVLSTSSVSPLISAMYGFVLKEAEALFVGLPSTALGLARSLSFIV